jgi:hypothetical protein
MNNLLTYHIDKKFALGILLNLIYDEDIKKRLQIQEIFGIGLRFAL